MASKLAADGKQPFLLTSAAHALTTADCSWQTFSNCRFRFASRIVLVNNKCCARVRTLGLPNFVGLSLSFLTRARGGETRVGETARTAAVAPKTHKVQVGYESESQGSGVEEIWCDMHNLVTRLDLRVSFVVVKTQHTRKTCGGHPIQTLRTRRLVARFLP